MCLLRHLFPDATNLSPAIGNIWLVEIYDSFEKIEESSAKLSPLPAIAHFAVVPGGPDVSPESFPEFLASFEEFYSTVADPASDAPLLPMGMELSIAIISARTSKMGLVTVLS